MVDELFERATSTSITLSWTKPEGDNTGYRIDYKPIKEGEDTSKDKGEEDEKDKKMKSMDVAKDATQVEVKGLEGAQMYQFDIYTISGEEESEVVPLQEKTSKVKGHQMCF